MAKLQSLKDNPFVVVTALVIAGLIFGLAVFQGHGHIFVTENYGHATTDLLLLVFTGTVALFVRPEVRSKGPHSYDPSWKHRSRTTRKLLYWLTIPLFLRFMIVYLVARYLLNLASPGLIAGGLSATDPIGVPIVTRMINVSYSLPMVGQWVLESALNDGIGVALITVFKGWPFQQIIDVLGLTVAIGIGQGAMQLIMAYAVRRYTKLNVRVEFWILMAVDITFIALGAYHHDSVIGQAALAAILQDWLCGNLLTDRPNGDEKRLEHMWEKFSETGMYVIVFAVMTIVPLALITLKVIGYALVIMASITLSRFLGSFVLRAFLKLKTGVWGEHYGLEMVLPHTAIGSVALAVPAVGAVEALLMGNGGETSYIVTMTVIFLSLLWVPISVWTVTRVEKHHPKKRPVGDVD